MTNPPPDKDVETISKLLEEFVPEACAKEGYESLSRLESALATPAPVGWMPPSPDPSAIKVHVVSYDSEKHQLNCRFPDGIVREVDPFVGCAIECTDDDYVEKGEACVGKDFIMFDSWQHGVYLCHRFEELPAPPHTEGR